MVFVDIRVYAPYCLGGTQWTPSIAPSCPVHLLSDKKNGGFFRLDPAGTSLRPGGFPRLVPRLELRLGGLGSLGSLGSLVRLGEGFVKHHYGA